MVQKQHAQIQNARHNLQITLIAENIRTPENVGMIMRLSEAFGVEKIYFVGDHALDITTKVKRASRNTYKTQDYEFVLQGEQVLQELGKSGYQTIALEITEHSKAIQNVIFKDDKKIALVIGSERQGVSEKILSRCHNHYHIPMFGDNSSINVVNALAIGLYKITDFFKFK